MPRDHTMDAREAAERRVRERFARQTAALIRWQQAQRQEDFRSQKQALDQLTEKERVLAEEREKALLRLERQWKEERDRLTPTPSRAPAFGLMPVPQRNVSQEYMRARERYETRREQLREAYDARAHECQKQRVEMHHRFLTANQARDRIYLDARIDLAERQNKAFERLVIKEVERSDNSVSREFERRSRGAERSGRG